MTHLGAEQCVTGSCHLLQANGLNIMVDCGLAQGDDPCIPIENWPLLPAKIDYLFLTHAHIDHIGRVPELIQKGFRGEIICSYPTKALLNPMLADAMKFSGLSEKETDSIEKTIDFDGLFAVESHWDHLKICDAKGPAVILAGSGMCTGGRIINHLRNGIDRSENDILFVGYQAGGTPGRAIQKYAKRPGGYVSLDGERKEINADVHTLSGYSAHADQKGFVDWVSSMPEKPGVIKLVHGEPRASTALAVVLESKGYNIDKTGSLWA